LRTTRFTVFSFAMAFSLLVLSVRVYAHHGAAMFDMERLITLKGTVTAFDWINPHSMIYIDAKDENGNFQKWTVEIRGGPSVLTRAGWNRDTLKPGDQVTCIGHPAKSGTNNMRLAKIVLANGQELNPDPRPFLWWGH
jgi:hypothetical protein